MRSSAWSRTCPVSSHSGQGHVTPAGWAARTSTRRSATFNVTRSTVHGSNNPNKTVKWTTLRSSAAVKDEDEVRWNHWRFTRSSASWWAL